MKENKGAILLDIAVEGRATVCLGQARPQIGTQTARRWSTGPTGVR